MERRCAGEQDVDGRLLPCTHKCVLTKRKLLKSSISSLLKSVCEVAMHEETLQAIRHTLKDPHTTTFTIAYIPWCANTFESVCLKVSWCGQLHSSRLVAIIFMSDPHAHEYLQKYHVKWWNPFQICHCHYVIMVRHLCVHFTSTHERTICHLTEWQRSMNTEMQLKTYFICQSFTTIQNSAKMEERCGFYIQFCWSTLTPLSLGCENWHFLYFSPESILKFNQEFYSA